jgi:hypothetical protein
MHQMVLAKISLDKGKKDAKEAVVESKEPRPYDF